MKNRLKSAFAIFLILIFSILIPSFWLFENEDTFVKETGSGIRTEAKYTDDTDNSILHDSYMRTESQKEFFSAQKFEQRRNIYRFSIELLAILIFTSGICLKWVYLSYIQFYSFPFARFLCEHAILLEKDGKKRVLAFGI